MAKKAGVLLPAVVLVAAAALVVPDLGAQIGDAVSGFFGGVELVGEGDKQFMVAASSSSQVRRCTPEQSLTQEACDNLKFVIFDARKMPFITRNISTAWKAAKPGVLTKDSTAEPGNRKVVCLRSFPRTNGGQCDEYPFASTREGGAGAQEMEVPPRENACQGGTLGAKYGAGGIRDGDSFLVVITHPDSIAQGPYQGVDIARDVACG
ncbi:NucA/NucB deoxyribonuclease domain-containing protein [Lentzea sp. BCCO 10_0798]|uniref:NucA/NucB deoxyribonuclease domain-containing protein n=1 Tax=Lentzea kristufekii TaxID=3095430 RepID=A0ABU4U033_9PSEU|nr:NucA/NucB deoxyribonuclease domain-containing protein [Lentzea sp. BCCO 10_0798]MDX8053487.1 NucA/NucB deoxyribonuclease domain-containing protein [Lentzea sp. BCCO 10_0798]